MKLKLRSRSGTLCELPSFSQQITLEDYIEALVIEVDPGEAISVTSDTRSGELYDGQPIPIELDAANYCNITIKTERETIRDRFVFDGGRGMELLAVQNLLSFTLDIQELMTDDNNMQCDFDTLFDSLDQKRITLLSVVRPMTGFDDDDFIDRMNSALAQKVRAICSTPKRGTRIDELIQDVSMVKRINTGTLTHLASHTEHWKGRTLNGLIPKRLRADVIEDEINTYENLFFKMAVDEVSDYVAQQLAALKRARRQNQGVIDWERIGASSFNEYKRGELLSRLLPDNSSEQMDRENRIFDKAINKWERASRTLLTIRSSAFYRSLSTQKHIRNNIHLTNILKNDQRYKALYDLWCAVRRRRREEQMHKEVEGASDAVAGSLEQAYATYSAVCFLYGLHLSGLEFSPDCMIGYDERGRLTIHGQAEDPCFVYRLGGGSVQDAGWQLHMEFIEKLNISLRVPDECSLSGCVFTQIESFAAYDSAKRELCFQRELEHEEYTQLARLLRDAKPNGRTVKQTSAAKREDDIWKEWVSRIRSRALLRNPQRYVMHIRPLCFEFAKEESKLLRLTRRFLEQTGEHDFLLFPIDLSDYENIRNDALMARLDTCGESFYAEDPAVWKDYNRGVLPVSQSDFSSIRRLMKLFTVQRVRLLIEWEGLEQPTHCPICQRTNFHQEDRDSFKCDDADCGIRWGATRCKEGCGADFAWVQPDGRVKKLDSPCDTPISRILDRENLFDRSVITDFEFEDVGGDNSLKMYPVCPKCGKRRFEPGLSPR